MTLDVRVLGDEHAEDVFALRMQAFRAPRSSLDEWRRHVDLSRYLGAFDGPRLVGVTAVLPLGQHFGGRVVPMGGVATVAVAAEERGRGVAGRLLEVAIGVMHDRGDAVSALHPATTGLYRSRGWELAGVRHTWSVPTGALRTLSRPGPVRLRAGSESDHDLLRACYGSVAVAHDGWLSRPPGWWRSILATGEHRYLSVAGEEGAADGYVHYRQTGSGPDGGYRLRVDELVARGHGAEVALWRLLGSYASQADRVTVTGASPDRLMLLLPEQVVTVDHSHHWMARLVDAPAAVAARGYRPGVAARVEIHLHDPDAPWNDGPWVLEVEAGEGRLRRGGDGEVRLGAGAMACLYTGWASAATLASVGLLHGPVTASAFDALFSGPRPTMIEQF